MTIKKEKEGREGERWLCRHRLGLLQLSYKLSRWGQFLSTKFQVTDYLTPANDKWTNALCLYSSMQFSTETWIILFRFLDLFICISISLLFSGSSPSMWHRKQSFRNNLNLREGDICWNTLRHHRISSDLPKKETQNGPKLSGQCHKKNSIFIHIFL